MASWYTRGLVKLAVLLPALALPARAEMIAADAAYPEGALWHDGALYWAEMTADRVMRRAGGATAVFWSREGCGPTAIAAAGGGFVIACHLDAALALVGPDGATRRLVDRDAAGDPIPWPNDAVGDGRGGVYVSSSGRFAPGAPATGRLLYLAGDRAPRVVAEGLHYANGVALAPDGATLYAAEHLGRRVLAFAVAAPGELRDRRVFADLGRLPPAGGDFDLAGPDGVEVAGDGSVLVAEYGAGRIAVYAADGALERLVAVPERFVTSTSIGPGGALFVTGAATLDPPARGAVRRLTLPAAR